MNDQQRAAMQMALEALWTCREHNKLYHGETHNTVIEADEAITALREALAQPQDTDTIWWPGIEPKPKARPQVGSSKMETTTTPQISDYDREFWGDGQPHPPHRCCECEECVAYFVDSVCESSFHPETWTWAQPQGEWVGYWNGKETAWFEHELCGHPAPDDCTIPLYTTPPVVQQDEPVAWITEQQALEKLCNYINTNFKTQKEAAKSLEMSEAHLSGVMNGKKRITAGMMSRLSLVRRTVYLEPTLQGNTSSSIVPIAKVCHDLSGHIGWNPDLDELPEEGTPLYTTPPSTEAAIKATKEKAAKVWIDPNDKTQAQYLPHIGEKVLFCHDGVTYYGNHTGGCFRTGLGITSKDFNTWECHWMYPPAAAIRSMK